MKNIHYTLLCFTFLFTACFEEETFLVDSSAYSISFADAEQTESEANKTLNTTIILGVPNDAGISFNIELSNTDAIEGIDYRLPAGFGSYTADAGENTLIIPLVELLDEEERDGDKFLEFSISSSGLNAGGFVLHSTQKINIRDNDFDLLGFTSFEEVPTFGTTNYESDDGFEMVNKPGLPPVDFTATGAELGFNSSYIVPGGADGSLDWGIWNSNDFTIDDAPFSFTDGVQGYASSDSDGLAEIVFDEVPINADDFNAVFVEFDVYFADASWEEDDEFDVYWRVGGENGEPILSLRAADGDMQVDGTNVEGRWITVRGDIPRERTADGQLVIEIGQDSGSELLFIDNIQIKGA